MEAEWDVFYPNGAQGEVLMNTHRQRTTMSSDAQIAACSPFSETFVALVVNVPNSQDRQRLLAVRGRSIRRSAESRRRTSCRSQPLGSERLQGHRETPTGGV